MNPLVQDMLNTVAGQDTELVFLEGLLEDDCKCAANHVDTGTSCTVRVVARKTTECGGLDFLICEASYKWNRYVMADPDRVCAGCDRDSLECWTIRPI